MRAEEDSAYPPLRNWRNTTSTSEPVPPFSVWRTRQAESRAFFSRMPLGCNGKVGLGEPLPNSLVILNLHLIRAFRVDFLKGNRSFPRESAIGRFRILRRQWCICSLSATNAATDDSNCARSSLACSRLDRHSRKNVSKVISCCLTIALSRAERDARTARRRRFQRKVSRPHTALFMSIGKPAAFSSLASSSFQAIFESSETKATPW